MPTISVITPVADGGHEYLREAYDSLANQELPSGWSWQWIVQQDGLDAERMLAALPNDDYRISPGMGRPGRAGMARTVALSRVTGQLVATLDADDLLTAGSLRRSINVLVDHPEIGWTTAAALDLHPDGQTTGVDTDPPGGRLAPGSLLESYEARRFSVLGTTTVARTDLVMAVGGWPALPSSEDVGLLLALEALAPGWFIPEVGVLYRKHETQSTKQAGFTDPAERRAREVLITSRAHALRAYATQTDRRTAAPC